MSVYRLLPLVSPKPSVPHDRNVGGPLDAQFYTVIKLKPDDAWFQQQAKLRTERLEILFKGSLTLLKMLTSLAG